MVLEAMRESLLGLPCISDTYSCCSGLLNLLQPACLHSSAEHPSATDLLHHAVQSNSNSCMHVNCAVVFAVGQDGLQPVQQGLQNNSCSGLHQKLSKRTRYFCTHVLQRSSLDSAQAAPNATPALYVQHRPAAQPLKPAMDLKSLVITAGCSSCPPSSV
jgi:hypothetical protein